MTEHEKRIREALRLADQDEELITVVASRDLRAMLATMQAHPAEVSDADDTELLDFMAEHRVSVAPEYEGQWCARRYDDETQAVDEVEAETPREALRELLTRHHGISTQGA